MKVYVVTGDGARYPDVAFAHSAAAYEHRAGALLFKAMDWIQRHGHGDADPFETFPGEAVGSFAVHEHDAEIDIVLIDAVLEAFNAGMRFVAFGPPTVLAQPLTSDHVVAKVVERINNRLMVHTKSRFTDRLKELQSYLTDNIAQERALELMMRERSPGLTDAVPHALERECVAQAIEAIAGRVRAGAVAGFELKWALGKRSGFKVAKAKPVEFISLDVTVGKAGE